jgi:tetratricopeptide (TPR) repeat protein
MSSPTPDPDRNSPSTGRHRSRLVWLLPLGILLIGLAWLLRESPWARERYLASLSTHSLSLLALERPNDVEVQERLGVQRFQDGDLVGSLQALTAAIKLDPERYDAQLHLGMGLASAGRVMEAERCFVKAATLRPKEARPHFLLAALYGQHRNVTSTIAPLEKGLELDPRNAQGWYDLGMSRRELHQWDEAIAALEKAVQLNDRRADFLRDLGQTQLYVGRADDARRSLERARDIDPKAPGILVVLAQTELQTGGEPERLKAAEALLAEAREVDPEFAATYRETGALLLRK